MQINNNNDVIVTDKATALVVSSSCQVSHVLPVVNGRLDASNCKRYKKQTEVIMGSGKTTVNFFITDTPIRLMPGS